MNRFEQSRIWQNNLAPKLNEDSHLKERELLRVEYEKFRERAGTVAGEIGRDLPQFTVHDMTHIDALWSLTDLILPNDFEINPAEVFVLGGAFLIHDLGMGLAAYPEGIDKLRIGTLWDDTVSYFYKKEYNRSPSDAELINPTVEIEKKTIEFVLRSLHAKHAEGLALTGWKSNGKNDEIYYLIDNKDLRDSYGKTIGLIAHSHWWSVDDISNKLSTRLGAPGMFPQEWTIDPIKLALILRIADAANIDDRRAPGFLRSLRRTSGYSDLHWNFQQKLYQPRVEASRLVYTSKTSFEIGECNSWWLCYDTLNLLDKELKEVDSLLAETRRQRMNVIAVAGIEDPKRMANLITVKDWQPVETQIKVGDVAQLVLRLGGTELYGDDYTVPLKELIQNGADAIRARRIIEGEDPNWGQIIIRTGNDQNGAFIEVEDNGVGMSPTVLTGPFLDFGQSFWGSPLMHEELPGLEAKRFTPTGKYGIGFYSIFMISNRVSIYSRRYYDSREDTWCLEFSDGVKGRPILRRALSTETIKNGGTRIRMTVNEDVVNKMLSNRKTRNWTFEDLITKICIALDVDVSFQSDNDEQKSLIKANDWISIPIPELVTRIMGKSNFENASREGKELLLKLASNIEVIKNEEGEVLGRCCIFCDDVQIEYSDYFTIEGVLVVGGINTDRMWNLLGVIVGKNIRAARDKAVPVMTGKIVQDWATRQAAKFEKFEINSKENLIDTALIVWRLRGDTLSLPVCKYGKKWISYTELVEVLKNLKCDIYLIGDYTISRLEGSLQMPVEVCDNVFAINFAGYDFFDHDQDFADSWPIDGSGDDFDSLYGLFIYAISEAWEIDKEVITKYLEFKRSASFKVGVMDGKDIQEDGTLYSFSQLAELKKLQEYSI